ncbi:MAG: HipA domain-containing protein [Opitutae bacterium]|nr:HipA domain-containing protein [Opitutae bacterium]MCD8299045.1 HipA domain-containing protein [Opitutae bacterium]
MRKTIRQEIANFVAARKFATASEIAKIFEISKPTAINELKKSGALALGNSVNRFYVLPREIPSLGAKWNLYRVGEDAGLSKLGVLTRTSAGFLFDGDYPALLGNEFPNGHFDSLPWLLADARPQGFVGRTIARVLAKFGFGSDPRNWRDDKIVEYFVRFGCNIPGALILGDNARDDFLRGHEPDLNGKARAATYPEFARRAMENGEPHSSAAGEQPKFCAMVKEPGGFVRNVVVKFSGETDSTEQTRVADLLIAEHVALRFLAKNGFPAPKTRLVFSENRVFLESDRIDRVGRYGRKPACSLSSIDAAFIGSGGGSWADAMAAAPDCFLEKEIALVKRLHDFGAAIGNNDMHFGNLSFYIEREQPFRLAPIYDMLPMCYAPLADGTMRQGALRTIPPTDDARQLASGFWRELANADNLSDNFRKIATDTAKALA